MFDVSLLNDVTIFDAISGIWTDVMEWVVNALPSITSIFYNPTNGLTFFGVLAVTALGLSIFFLLMGILQNFLHLRG